MPHYRIYHRILRCNEALPELPTARSAKPYWDVRFEPLSDPKLPKDAWYHTWRLPNGRIAMKAARVGRAFFLYFPKLGRFLVSARGHRIVVSGERGIERRVLRHLLLDQVIPWSLSVRGKLVVHAGAVQAPGGAVVLVGDAGRGKSTLCASLAKRGWPVLTDDGVLIERKKDTLTLVPSYPGIRLWPDSDRAVLGAGASRTRNQTRAGKRRLRSRAWCATGRISATNIARICFLERPSRGSSGKQAVSMEKPTAAQVFMALVRQTFRLNPTDPKAMLREFLVLKAIARRPVFRTLRYPLEYKLLPRLHHVLRSDLDGRCS